MTKKTKKYTLNTYILRFIISEFLLIHLVNTQPTCIDANNDIIVMIKSNGQCSRSGACSDRYTYECIDSSYECRTSFTNECNLGVDCNLIGNKYCAKSSNFDCGDMIAENYCRNQNGLCISLTNNSCRNPSDFSCVPTSSHSQC